jgi:hypothetical protein
MITGDLTCGLDVFFFMDFDATGGPGDDAAQAPLPFVEANLMLTSSFFETKRDSDLISTSPSLKQLGEDFARLFRFLFPEEETLLGLK